MELIIIKKSLAPIPKQLDDLVNILKEKASKDNQYNAVSEQMTEMHASIMNEMNTLKDESDHQLVLNALHNSQKIISDALENGEFAKHRGFARNCSGLQKLCVCLDLIANFFTFLGQKTAKVLSGDNDSICANMQAFKLAMFKPLPTSTASKIKALNTDIEWYIKVIKDEFHVTTTSKFESFSCTL